MYNIEDILYCYLLISVVYFSFISANLHPDGYEYTECTPTESTCEYWLVIQEKLTMIYLKNLVYAHKGKLYLYNEHHSNYTTNVRWHPVIYIYIYSRISISRILDKSNCRCLKQNNRSHPYQFRQNDYSISRILDISNKFVGPL